MCKSHPSQLDQGTRKNHPGFGLWNLHLAGLKLCGSFRSGRKHRMRRYGYGSIPINTIFSGMNIHKSQLF